MQRPAIAAGGDVGFGRARLFARKVEGARDERVQLRFERLDAFYQRIRVFGRRKLAGADEFGCFRDGQEMQICGHVGRP